MIGRLIASRRALWSLAFIVLLIVASLMILNLAYDTHAAAKLSKQGKHAEAAERLEGSRLNLISRYKLPYNQGTALSHAGKYASAQEVFQQALDRTDNRKARCKIAYNLVLTIEADGDAAIGRKDVPAAAKRYSKALTQLDRHKQCFTGKQTKKRIEAKLEVLDSPPPKQQEPDEAEQPDKSSEVRNREEEAAQSRAETIDTFDQDPYTDDVIEQPW